MTTDHGLDLLTEFKTQALKDGDAFFVIHFSREQDRFEGDYENMDSGDALLIIKHLVQKFNLNPEVISAI